MGWSAEEVLFLLQGGRRGGQLEWAGTGRGHMTAQMLFPSEADLKFIPEKLAFFWYKARRPVGES